ASIDSQTRTSFAPEAKAVTKVVVARSTSNTTTARSRTSSSVSMLGNGTMSMSIFCRISVPLVALVSWQGRDARDTTHQNAKDRRHQHRRPLAGTDWRIYASPTHVFEGSAHRRRTPRHA